MNADDEEAVRSLVQQSIAKALGQQPELIAAPATLLRHSSHYRYVLPESDGPCLIEPSVQCTHCGYCQSHGH